MNGRGERRGHDSFNKFGNVRKQREDNNGKTEEAGTTARFFVFSCLFLILCKTWTCLQAKVKEPMERGRSNIQD